MGIATAQLVLIAMLSSGNVSSVLGNNNNPYRQPSQSYLGSLWTSPIQFRGLRLNKIAVCMGISKVRGPECRPQCTVSLLMETPEGTPTLRKPSYEVFFRFGVQLVGQSFDFKAGQVFQPCGLYSGGLAVQ